VDATAARFDEAGSAIKGGAATVMFTDINWGASMPSSSERRPFGKREHGP